MCTNVHIYIKEKYEKENTKTVSTEFVILLLPILSKT